MAFRLAQRLLLQVAALRAGIAVNALVHQRMRAVEQPLDRVMAVTLLAVHDIALGEFQIIQNAVGVGPLLEQIIVLEERSEERRVGKESVRTFRFRWTPKHEKKKITKEKKLKEK